VTVVTTILTNWISNQLRNQKTASPPEKTNIALRKDQDGLTLTYDHLGQPLSGAQFEQLMRLFDKSVSEPILTPDVSPYPEYPLPLFLEHSSKIVGWGLLKPGADGVTMMEGIILDNEIQKRIDAGELRGLSIAGIVQESICSICQDDYVKCNHLAGHSYNDVPCTNTVVSFRRLTGVSLVSEPVNRATLITQFKNP